jgi:uncharacterized membrane protein YesL
MTARGPGAIAALPGGAPASPRAASALRLWQGLPGLLSANTAFLLWCAPFGLLALLGLPLLALGVAPLTVGPGLVALVAAAARVSRDEPVAAWSRNLRDARAGFSAGAALAAGFLLAWHAQLLALRMVLHHRAEPAAVSLWAAEIAVLTAGALAGVHALALAGTHGQGALRAARNGLLLAVRHPGATLAILAMIGSGAVLTWTLAGAPLVIVPGVLAFGLVSVTQRLVDGEKEAA